jgi:hypothetical protein
MTGLQSVNSACLAASRRRGGRDGIVAITGVRINSRRYMRWAALSAPAREIQSIGWMETSVKCLDPGAVYRVSSEATCCNSDC